MHTLKTQDLIALGFMTFALFLGAGNIIFPPVVGQAAGEHLWSATLGFLLTGVGLPLLTVIALARVGGGMDRLTAPLGRTAGTLLSVAVYLALGPLFATPRTATVSFEMGFAPFVGNTPAMLMGYSLAYFAVVMLLALFPGKLIDNVGKLITPALIVGLVVLGVAAFVLPAGPLATSTGDYQQAALAQGFLQGYQTMDALGALVFGIVIVNAIKQRGITAIHLHTRYATLAAVIAAAGLGLVYISLIHLGAHSSAVAPSAQTGVHILTAYVQHTFGAWGSVLLAVVITLACLTTGVGLVTACGEYFSARLGLSYRTVVVVVSLFGMLVSNQGLAQLIAISVPVLVGIYPMAIALVLLSLLGAWWRTPSRVYAPVMLVALVFGLADGLNAAGWTAWVPAWMAQLPGTALGLGWLLPVGLTLVLAGLWDRGRGMPATA